MKKKQVAVKAGKLPRNFEKPSADSRTFEEIIKTPTRDFLRKLSATADLALCASRLPNDEFEPERKAAKEDYATIRVYFHLLTARAMENRKFADYLVPILYELGQSAVYDRRFYADLASILRFKYKYSFSLLAKAMDLKPKDVRARAAILNPKNMKAAAFLKPEDVERDVQKLAVNVNIDTIMGDWGRLVQKIEKIEKGPPKIENLMFG